MPCTPKPLPLPGSDYGMLCALQKIVVQVPNSSPTGPAVSIRAGVPVAVTNPAPWAWAQDGGMIAVP
jgi:hypothetical protein